MRKEVLSRGGLQRCKLVFGYQRKRERVAESQDQKVSSENIHSSVGLEGLRIQVNISWPKDICLDRFENMAGGGNVADIARQGIELGRKIFRTASSLHAG